MQDLLERFTPNPKYQRPQNALRNKLQRTWNLYGSMLLHMIFLGYPRITSKSRACSDAYAAISVVSVVANRLAHSASLVIIRCFSPLIVKRIYSIISVRFPSMNIENIGNSWKTLRPPGALCTAFIGMHRLPYTVWWILLLTFQLNQNMMCATIRQHGDMVSVMYHMQG